MAVQEPKSYSAHTCVKRQYKKDIFWLYRRVVTYSFMKVVQKAMQELSALLSYHMSVVAYNRFNMALFRAVLLLSQMFI